jgi:hypothetical protein
MNWGNIQSDSLLLAAGTFKQVDQILLIWD